MAWFAISAARFTNYDVQGKIIASLSAAAARAWSARI